MSSRRQFLRLERFLDDPGPITIGAGCVAAQHVDCRSCVEACPEAALVLPIGRPVKPQVDAARCTRCGDCVSVCPTQALCLNAQPERCYA